MSSSIVLVCAVLASLAVGVVIAYGVCLTMFSMFRAHARHVWAEQQVVRPVSVTNS